MRKGRGVDTSVIDAIMVEARQMREDAPHLDEDTTEILPTIIDDRARQIAEMHGYEVGSTYMDVATGQRTPVSPLVGSWKSEAVTSPKTEANYQKAVNEFLAWNGSETFAERVDRRLAGRFVTDHLRSTKQLTPQSVNKYVSGLSSFWSWLVKRGYASENPWKGQGMSSGSNRKANGNGDDGKRPFTDGEVRTLLNNAPDSTLYEFMLMLALTGMRREEVAQLRVRDLEGGCFHIRDGKTKAARRRVPIHSRLQVMVEGRTEGKAAADYLFHEVNSEGLSRADAIGKRFITYRRRVGLVSKPEGQSKGRVDMHSFRRWFATKAEQAGQPVHIIEFVQGWKREGMGAGRYSGGPSTEQLRQCVEAVQIDGAEPA